MGINGLPDSSLCVLPKRSYSDVAEDYRAAGRRVIEAHGTQWVEIRPGFYEPPHRMLRLSIAQAKRPTPLCWGYRIALNPEDSDHANGFIPMHLLENFEHYDETVLPAKRRRQLVKSRSQIRLVWLPEPGPLVDQGHEIVRSFYQRVGLRKLPSLERFQTSIREQYQRGSRETIAAMVGETMAGFITFSAIGSTAYLHSVCIASEYLPLNIGTALAYEVVQVCRRTEGIREISYGLEFPADPNLGRFKENMGFLVKRIPIRHEIPSIMLTLLHRFSPHRYYRLVGGDTPSIVAAGALVPAEG